MLVCIGAGGYVGFSVADSAGLTWGGVAGAGLGAVIACAI